MFSRKPIPEPVIIPISQIRQGNESKVKDLRILRFEEFLTARSLAPNSQKAYQKDIKYFLDWCDTPWGNVEPRQIAQFKGYLLRKDDRGLRVVKDSSVKRILGTLKNFYNWLFRSGYVKFDPTIAVELPHTPEPGANNLSLQIIERIFEALETINYPERNLALFSLLLHGLRASEACALNIEDYDGARVRIKQAKAGSVGVVPLEEWCQELIDNYLAWRKPGIDDNLELEPLFLSCSNRNVGERISYDTINKLCEQITKITGIKFKAHQLRHTFATNLVLSGVNPYHAMTLMRHKSVSNFRRYTKAADAAAAEADFNKVSQAKSILRGNG